MADTSRQNMAFSTFVHACLGRIGSNVRQVDFATPVEHEYAVRLVLRKASGLDEHAIRMALDQFSETHWESGKTRYTVEVVVGRPGHPPPGFWGVYREKRPGVRHVLVPPHLVAPPDEEWIPDDGANPGGGRCDYFIGPAGELLGVRFYLDADRTEDTEDYYSQYLDDERFLFYPGHGRIDICFVGAARQHLVSANATRQPTRDIDVEFARWGSQTALAFDVGWPPEQD